MKVNMNNIILKHGNVEISICQHRGEIYSPDVGVSSYVEQEVAVLPNCDIIYKYNGTLSDLIHTLKCVEEELNSPDVGVKFSGLMVRLGAYGDPSAVPSSVWDDVLLHSKGRTGYTHQFGVEGADVRPDLCMISADTEAEARVQWGLGNRTFRVGHTVDEMVKGHEILCPASEEAGKRTTCNECKLCIGNGI